MSCQYKHECPSYSGWCEGPKQDFERCVPFLVTAFEGAKKENELLLKRFRHLLLSDVIAQYDEVDPRTGEHVRDIRELEYIVKAPKVLYLCDRRACEKCSPECSYTKDITHAMLFEKIGETFVESGTPPVEKNAN